MLTRSIEFDDGPRIEVTAFRHAKRLCAAVAVVAIGMAALDLMHVGTPANALSFANGHRASLAAFPAFALERLRKIEIRVAAPDDQVAVAIPPAVDHSLDRAAAIGPQPRMPAPVALDELSAATRKNAVELAMAAPALAAAPVQLASLDSAVTVDSADPEPSVRISLPDRLTVLPPAAPGVPPPSPIERLHLAGKTLARAEHCLANAIYFEARDQPYKGQVAVAQVVMNRVFSGFYPEDVCGVIYQNADHHLACQFTFACDGKRKVINERGAWARANRIARETLAGKLYETAVGTATHYHALYVHPYWTRQMRKLVRYGIHSFYRPIAWGSGADEPVWSKLAMKSKTKN